MNEIEKHDFSMQELMNLVGQTNLNINSMANKVREVSDKVDSFEKSIVNIEDRMDNLETREEITYEQQNTIDSLISQVVYSRLGIKSEPAKWSISERTINKKYGRLFRSRLRREVSNKGHLAYPFRTTKKGNFKDACKDIEAWFPKYGIDALKREADENAIADKIAREQGYLNEKKN